MTPDLLRPDRLDELAGWIRDLAETAPSPAVGEQAHEWANEVEQAREALA